MIIGIPARRWKLYDRQGFQLWRVEDMANWLTSFKCIIYGGECSKFTRSEKSSEKLSFDSHEIFTLVSANITSLHATWTFHFASCLRQTRNFSRCSSSSSCSYCRTSKGNRTALKNNKFIDFIVSYVLLKCDLMALLMDLGNSHFLPYFHFSCFAIVMKTKLCRRRRTI